MGDLLMGDLPMIDLPRGDDLIGVWTLESLHRENVETAERTEPFGPRPRGTLIFHPGGRMVALLTPREPSAAAGEAAHGAAVQKLVAYSGRYRLEPPDRFVTSVDVASFESWVGTDQVRRFKLDRDRLEIVNTPTGLPNDGGRESVFIGILSWVRETGAEAGPLDHASD